MNKEEHKLFCIEEEKKWEKRTVLLTIRPARPLLRLSVQERLWKKMDAVVRLTSSNNQSELRQGILAIIEWNIRQAE